MPLLRTEKCSLATIFSERILWRERLVTFSENSLRLLDWVSIGEQVRGRLFASFDSLLLTMKHCYRSSTPTVVVFEEAPVFAPYNGSTRTFTPWTFPLFWGILLLHFTITNGESRMTQRTSATGIFWKTQGDFPPIMWVMDVHGTYTCSLCLVSFQCYHWHCQCWSFKYKLQNDFRNPIWMKGFRKALLRCYWLYTMNQDRKEASSASLNSQVLLSWLYA